MPPKGRDGGGTAGTGRGTAGRGTAAGAGRGSAAGRAARPAPKAAPKASAKSTGKPARKTAAAKPVRKTAAAKPVRKTSAAKPVGKTAAAKPARRSAAAAKGAASRRGATARPRQGAPKSELDAAWRSAPTASPGGRADGPARAGRRMEVRAGAVGSATRGRPSGASSRGGKPARAVRTPKSSRAPRPPKPPKRPRSPRPPKQPRTVRLADPRKRLRVSLIGVCVVLSLFGGRLIQLQGIDASTYASVADRIGLKTVAVRADRGVIIDRDGEPLASTVEAYTVEVDQTQVTNPAAYALQLEGILGTDAAALQRDLTGTDRYVVIGRGVPGSVWRQVRALGLAGLTAAPAPARDYPAGIVAGNVVGFLGADGLGLTGLEQAMDETLAGVDGEATYQFSPGGIRIPNSSANHVTQPVAGTGLRLTLDGDVQWNTEQVLAEAVANAGAADGVAVVMDVDTQEIVALAATPAFDPSDPSKTEAADRGSAAVEDAYEPGSVFKPITMSAVVDQGLADHTTVFSVPDSIRRGGETIHDYYSHGEDQMTLAGVVAKSSNVGTVLAAETLDKDVYHDYLRRFGFGTAPDLGLPGETGGRLPSGDDFTDLTRDNVAFGQGISVSAVQMASAYATIASGGVRVDPRLIAATIGADGRETPVEPSAPERIISEETAAEVTTMMEAVMGEGGTGKPALVDGYRIAGKTGTAQRVDPDCGCYADYNSSFMGFAPADDPRYVVVVSLFDPKNGNSGSALAGPAFADIMRFALEQGGVAPTGTEAPQVPLFAD
ncbi:penicillin-binding transpeptidase domain-containing protein [Jiangella endophytica]|uniref:penicillin-binding transpeptidase domain-containing protein n=1 Tax=Jiangella endophytica TaxID=1623398 RepID=UPI000E3511D5|nr:penicillin-binding transpeptidase domain-containing protein [Jiangella endophytica]